MEIPQSPLAAATFQFLVPSSTRASGERNDDRARRASRTERDDGGDSSGVEHLATASVGDEVIATATVTEVDGKRIHFSVECHSGTRLIAKGVIAGIS